MSKRINIIGNVYGKITVISEAHQIKNRRYWNCTCSCGTKLLLITNALTSKTRGKLSCGCSTLTNSAIDYYGAHSKLWNVWRGAKKRCYLKSNISYKYYGERGITMYTLWKNNYSEFKKWALSSGYKEGLTLDRRDNNKNYKPSNCRWVTALIQNRNQSTTKMSKKKALLAIDMYQSKNKIKNIASHFKVSISCINNIIYSKYWNK